ncbi:MAG: transglycosylase SLT domain-containing protein [Prevotellaceae bacterium]|jgi:membrane-bound lytic murein transglycosylase D|nr:transglycosylase SLT domain-containing protein [Prevotellaceae bacterium]
MKKILIIFIANILFFNASAQENNALDNEISNEDTDFEYSNTIDSLLSAFYLQNIDTTDYFNEDEYMPAAELHDSVYINRLSQIASVVHLPYNDIVRRFIIVYTQKYRNKTEEILSLGDYYFPVFEEILYNYGLPLELKTMAVIESALNPIAVSRVKATGAWQFMFRTAKYYGLNITSFVDERCDPVAACHAAAKYMSTMYKIFGDWTLVIASYNCGEGNVKKAIRRAGGKTDYWSIYPYLPRETRGYVPMFIGATYALTYYKEHGLKKAPPIMPVAVDTFIVNKMLHFEQISKVIGIPIETIRSLNPQYRRDIIPGKEKPYTLILPHTYTIPFIDNENLIYSYNDSVYFNPKVLAAPAQYSVPAGSGKQIVHIVKKGETVGGIAQKYKVSSSNLRYWNNIGNNNLIRIGQKLVIYRKS